jgi:anaerobic ribonucleoside-triphosphate reductase activating protein
MNYAAIKNCDIANGPGVRVSLFVSGCTHHCKGCFNEIAWDFDYGTPFTQRTIDQILEMLRPEHIKGITLLGGEPFEPQNQPPLLELLRQIKSKYPEKNIWAFSGYLFDKDILAQKLGPWEITEEFISYIDVLVDGPFVLEKKDLSLRFRGSSNQRLIDVPASLKENAIVLWEDWQGNERGMK